MRLIFLGPPGAGKGTMASRLAQTLNIPHISTGDIIRQAIRSGTKLGKQVKQLVDSGDLVPDELTVELVKERLDHQDAQKGFILDGFPRTIPQADALKTISNIELVVNFVLTEDEIVRRLSGRRVHPGSGRTYHILFNPPNIENIDDVTGEPLDTRPDDQVDAIRKRLEIYRNQTSPLIGYYQNLNMLEDLDASLNQEQVFSQLLKMTAQKS
jgi:adenylate kinase